MLNLKGILGVHLTDSVQYQVVEEVFKSSTYIKVHKYYEQNTRKVSKVDVLCRITPFMLLYYCIYYIIALL